jgi:hypothetical protein
MKTASLAADDTHHAVDEPRVASTPPPVPAWNNALPAQSVHGLPRADADAAAHEAPDFSHATASSTRLAPQSPRHRRRSPRRHVDAQRLETNKFD